MDTMTVCTKIVEYPYAFGVLRLLKDYLENPSQAIRFACIRAFSNIHGTVEVLKEDDFDQFARIYSSDSDMSVREAALEVLIQLAATMPIAKAMRNFATEHGVQAIAVLKASLQNPEPSVRVAGVAALGRTQNPDYLPLLLHASCHDCEGIVRRAAGRAH